MKKILTIILCVLLCVGLGGIAYTLTKGLKPDTNIETPNDSNSGEDTGGENPGGGGFEDDGNEDDSWDGVDNGDGLMGLVVAPNEASFIKQGMDMVSGASIYIGEEEYEPAMRFTFNVSAALKAEVEADSNKQLLFMFAPLTYFDSVNTDNYTYIDWVAALNNAGKKAVMSPVSESDFSENGSNYIVRFRVENIPYQNMNRKVVCMLVLATTTGDDIKYQYNAYESGVTYRSNARSFSYVAAASLNAQTLSLVHFDAAQVARLKRYVNMSVDLANGLSAPTDDGSTVVVEVAPTTPETVSVGEKFKVEAFYTPESVNFPIWYRSTDPSVLTVDDYGNVTALKAGTAVINVYVAGDVYSVTVTVL